MKRTLVLAALFAHAVALAQTAMTTPIAPPPDVMFDLFRGSTAVTRNIVGHDACVAAARVDTVSRLAGANYSCRTQANFSTTFVPAPPPCPPAPAVQTRTQACTAPEIGSWTQTLTYTAAPQPTCWIAGAWVPSTPPAGACVTPPPPAPTGVWSLVTAGTTNPQFAPDASVTPNAAGVTFYRNGVLNRTDSTGPAQGSVYEMFPSVTLVAGDVLRAAWTDTSGTSRFAEHTVGGAAPPPPPPPPPPPTGTAALTWDASPDARVTGYRVYSRLTGPFPVTGVAVNTNNYSFSELASGTWCFAVTAVGLVDGASSESLLSTEACKVIP